MADWVELRVHGVHGTSPGAMLGVPDDGVGQVAGDRLTGVYRASGGLPLRTRRIASGVDGAPGRIEVEAYSWGALTSGAQGALGWLRRLGWMMLLPFALANLAYWARLQLARGGPQDRMSAWAVRASALLLTVFMVLTPCLVAIDMLGWQCFSDGSAGCARLPGAFDVLDGMAPGRRLVLTSAVPLLVLGLLWLLSQQTQRAYEAPAQDRINQDRPAGEVPVLRRLTLWRSQERTVALRRLHVAASLAAVVAFVSFHVARVGVSDGLRVLAVALVVLAGLVVLGCLVVLAVEQRGDLLPDGAAAGPAPSRGQGLLLLAFVLVAVQSVALWRYAGPMDQTRGYQGADTWFLGMFVLLTALHLAVFFGARMPLVPATMLVLVVAGGGVALVVGAAGDQAWDRSTYAGAVLVAVLAWAGMLVWHHRFATLEATRGMPSAEERAASRAALRKVAWRGAGASVLLAAAAWVALLFTTTAVVTAANYLNGELSVADLASGPGDVSTRPADQTSLVIPQVLAWAPLGQLVWFVACAGVLLWCYGRYRSNGGAEIAAVLAGRPAEPDARVPARDRGAAAARRRLAGFAHRAETLLDAIGATTALVGLLLLVSTLGGLAPWDRSEASWPRTLASVSFFVMLGLAAGLVLVGSYLRRSEAARKAVGVLWDLTTFWPRAAHPLAPPCYAERVVPELKTRTRWALGADPDNRVILSGHSQGSLILAATATRLDDADLGRVRLITYGSQIRALYGRVFPRVLGAAAIGYEPTAGRSRLQDGAPDTGYGHEPPRPPAPGSLRARIEEAGGSWVNLFRRSDPLGFRVFSDDDAVLPPYPVPPLSGSDLPVMEVPVAGRGDPGPVVSTHSGYQHSEVYRDVVARWTHETPFEETYDPDGVVDLPVLPRT